MYKYFAIALALVIVGAIAWLIPSPSQISVSPGIDVSKAQLAQLEGRTIVDSGQASGGVIAYSYLGAPLPEKVDADEVVELRTESSVTKFDGVVKQGQDPTLQLTSIIYSQPAFAQDEKGVWHQLEYATTTEQAFRNRPIPLYQHLAEVFVRTAYADSISPFSEAGDGHTMKNATCSGAPIAFDPCPCSSFSDAREATDADSNDDTSATANIYVVDESYYDINDFSQCNTTFRRVFLPFSTTAIPSGATISAGTLNVYVQSVLDQINDTKDYATVVRTSQGTHTVLENADYDQCGAVTSPTEGVDAGQRKDLTSVSAGAYLTFTLNSTGLGWIAKSGVASNCSATTGITCLGLREGHDVEQWGVGGAGQANYLQIYTSEQTGTSNDPYLSVTYSVAASAAQKSGMKIQSFGTLKVLNGGIKIK